MKQYWLILSFLCTLPVLANTNSSMLTLSFSTKACKQCPEIIEGYLQNFPGVTKAQVVGKNNLIRVEYQNKKTTPVTILQQLLEKGFLAKLIPPQENFN